jgi:hypothetical protein
MDGLPQKQVQLYNTGLQNSTKSKEAMIGMPPSFDDEGRRDIQNF